MFCGVSLKDNAECQNGNIYSIWAIQHLMNINPTAFIVTCNKLHWCVLGHLINDETKNSINISMYAQCLWRFKIGHTFLLVSLSLCALGPQYRPCADLHCGIPLSDYCLSPLTLPLLHPPQHSNSVHVLQTEWKWKWEHPSPYTCTHTYSFQLCSGPYRTGVGVELMDAFHIDHIQCSRRCLVTLLWSTPLPRPVLSWKLSKTKCLFLEMNRDEPWVLGWWRCWQRREGKKGVVPFNTKNFPINHFISYVA